MLSNKPYLVRAFYEWIVDSVCTPFILVNAVYPHCKVPEQHVDENGQITLNVSPDAVRDFKISNEFLEFRASFSGIVYFISAPMKAILAVYAQENGQGMFFDFEDEVAEGQAGWENAEMPIQQPSILAQDQVQDKKRPSHLKLVE
jgi:stringent starvation protein B